MSEIPDDIMREARRVLEPIMLAGQIWAIGEVAAALLTERERCEETCKEWKREAMLRDALTVLADLVETAWPDLAKTPAMVNARSALEAKS